MAVADWCGLVSVVTKRTEFSSRDFCIFRFTLAMTFTETSMQLFFFVIMKVTLVRTVCTQGYNADSMEAHLMKRSKLLLSRPKAPIFPEERRPTPRFESFGFVKSARAADIKFRRIKHGR